jgi:hypothetical protein
MQRRATVRSSRCPSMNRGNSTMQSDRHPRSNRASSASQVHPVWSHDQCMQRCHALAGGRWSLSECSLALVVLLAISPLSMRGFGSAPSWKRRRRRPSTRCNVSSGPQLRRHLRQLHHARQVGSPRSICPVTRRPAGTWASREGLQSDSGTIPSAQREASSSTSSSPVAAPVVQQLLSPPPPPTPSAPNWPQTISLSKGPASSKIITTATIAPMREGLRAPSG